jgi:hypothetical protein
MIDRFEPVVLAMPLPPDCVPEGLVPSVASFIVACWTDMSRAQLLERARRIGLNVLLRVLPDPVADGLQRHTLQLFSQDRRDVHMELVAHVRGVARRRAKASLPQARDGRPGGLF